MTDFLSIRTRIARHAMESRALAGELRSFVAAEERARPTSWPVRIRHETAGEDDEAEAVNDESNALEERLEAMRGLRDAVNEASGSMTEGVADLDACGEERTADAARH